MKWMMPFISSGIMRVSISPSSSISPPRSRSRVKKNLAVLKRTMAELPSCWVTEFSGQVEEASTPGELERSLSHSGRTGDVGKRQERYLDSKGVR